MVNQVIITIKNIVKKKSKHKKEKARKKMKENRQGPEKMLHLTKIFYVLYVCESCCLSKIPVFHLVCVFTHSYTHKVTQAYRLNHLFQPKQKEIKETFLPNSGIVFQK